MEPVKHFEYEVRLTNNEANIEDIISVGRLVRDDWQSDKIQSQQLTGGYVNVVYKLRLDGDTEEEEAIAVRVYRGNSYLMVDGKCQMMAMRAANAAWCGGEFLATFTNGIIYRYSPGETINPIKYDNDDIRRAVAEAMARFHHEGLAIAKNGGEPRIYDDVKTSIEQLPSEFGTGVYEFNVWPLRSKDEFIKEISDLEEEVKKVKIDVVLGHGDLWWANVVYDKKKDSMSFIDFDHAGYHTIVHDLASFINESRISPGKGDVEFLTESEEKLFLSAYLTKRLELRGMMEPVSGNDVERLYSQCVLYKPFAIAVLMVVILRLHKPLEPSIHGIVQELLAVMFNKLKTASTEYKKHKPIQDFSICNIEN